MGPDKLTLMSQVMIFGLFAVSLDMALGYAGILTVGHAAFFGAGAYAAGLLAKYGWSEPFTGLLFALIGGCHPAHATEIQPDMTPVALPEPSNAVSVLVMLVFAVATCVAAKRLSAHKRKGDQWEHTNQRTKA